MRDLLGHDPLSRRISWQSSHLELKMRIPKPFENHREEIKKLLVEFNKNFPNAQEWRRRYIPKPQDLITTIHNVSCTAGWRRSIEWHKRWPNACGSCNGAGYHHYAGSYWEPPQDDPCSCIEDGKCPRCGDEIMFVADAYCDKATCLNCYWDESLYTKHDLTQEQRSLRDEMHDDYEGCFCYPIGTKEDY